MAASSSQSEHVTIPSLSSLSLNDDNTESAWSQLEAEVSNFDQGGSGSGSADVDVHEKPFLTDDEFRVDDNEDHDDRSKSRASKSKHSPPLHGVSSLKTLRFSDKDIKHLDTAKDTSSSLEAGVEGDFKGPRTQKRINLDNGFVLPQISFEDAMRSFHYGSFDPNHPEVKGPEPILSPSVDLESTEELLEQFNGWFDKWKGEIALQRSAIDQAYLMYGLPPGSHPTLGIIEVGYDKLCTELGELQTACDMNNLLPDNALENGSDQGTDLAIKFNQLWDLIYSSRYLLMFEAYMENVRDESRGSSNQIKIDLFRFKEVNYTSLAPMQNLTLFILRQCSVRGLRKIGSQLFREIITPEGCGTYAYEEYKTIESFVRSQCDKNTKFDQWCNMTDRGAAALTQTVKYLENCEDLELPVLETDRTITSWRNGVYLANLRINSNPPKFTTKFIPYSFGRLPKKVQSCKYFDTDYDDGEYKHFMDIVTPVQQILEYQGFSREDMSFIFCMFGRLVFTPGTHDQWEVIPMLWGQAGTGKSSCIEACSRMFAARDVAALGNTIEKTFGLAPLVDKKLFVANDIKHNFGLDAGDLQTMTSLEQMSINVKFKTAITKKWNVPGIFAGNDLPRSWKDKLDSMARRLVLIVFGRRIQRRDNTFKKRIGETFGSFYRLCVEAYHWWAAHHGTEDIWEYVPEKIKRGQQIVREEGNPLLQFLHSHEVLISPDAQHVKSDVFLHRYKQYCDKYGYRQPALSPSELKANFKTYNVKVVTGKLVWPLGGNSKMYGEFYVGMEIVEAPLEDVDS